MAVAKTKKSPYYYTRFSVRGVRVQESTGEVTKSEALRYEEKRKKEVREQIVYGVKKRYSWKEAVTRWLTEMQHKRSLKEDARKFIELEKYFGQLYLEELNKERINNCIRCLESRPRLVDKARDQKLSTATINRYIELIKAVLNKAHKEWDWLEVVPYIAKKKENNNVIRWITKEEANRLLAELPQYLREMVEFSLTTGLRASNVRCLTWDEVDFGRELLTIAPSKFKNGEVFTAPINSQAMAVLRRQIRHISHNYVFTYNGKPLSVIPKKTFKAACSRAGIENFRWHDLRHTFATWLALAGVQSHVIKELMGHKDIKTTMQYMHVAKEYLRDASEKLVEVV
jgi:integrase